MVFDEARHRLLIADRDSDAIMAVNVETGARSVVASNLALNDTPEALTLAIDRPGNRLFISVVDAVSNQFRSKILEMDLTTDDVEVLIPLVPEYRQFHDLALSADGDLLYVLNNREKRQIYVVDPATRQFREGTNVLEHKFSDQLTTIETGPSNNSVYMFDQMSGAVMLMQINEVSGSTHLHEYEGVILSQ
jgi:hypothetical protein